MVNVKNSELVYLSKLLKKKIEIIAECPHKENRIRKMKNWRVFIDYIRDGRINNFIKILETQLGVSDQHGKR